jgi:hypothetical protein
VIAQRLADFQNGLELTAPSPSNPGALVHRASDLIQVSADRAELADGVSQRGELVSR